MGLEPKQAYLDFEVLGREKGFWFLAREEGGSLGRLVVHCCYLLINLIIASTLSTLGG